MKFLLAIFLVLFSFVSFAQYNQSHFQKYTYDFSVDGGAIGAKDLSAKANKAVLPVGAIVKSVVAVVKTPFTSTGAATVSWGNGDAADGFSGSAVTATSALTANVVINGWDSAASLLWDDTNDHPIHLYIDDATTGKFTMTIASVAVTAGKIDFLVEYLLP